MIDIFKPRSRWRFRRYLDLIAALFFVLLCNVAVADFVQDDGYIAFRYAENWVKRGTLYYNPGETGPFGYTNPLYIGLLALFRWLLGNTFSLGVISRLLASVTFLVILYGLFRGLAVNVTDPLIQTLVVVITGLVVVTLPYLLPNFFSGLETALFAGALLTLVGGARDSLLYEHKDRSIRDTWFAVALGFALSLRFDALVSCLPLAFVYAWSAWRSRRWSAIAKLAGGVFFAAGIYAANWALTGHLLPLSFEHKTNPHYDWTTVAAYMRLFILCLSPLMLVSLVSGRWRSVLFYGSYYTLVAAFYGFFTRWHFYRYAFPFLFVIFCLLLMENLRHIERWTWRWYLVFVFYVWVVFLPLTLDGYSWVSGYRVAMEGVRRLGDAMVAAQLPEEDRVYASYDAGYLAYHTDWKLLDLAGLTTPKVQVESMGTVVQRVNPTVLLISGTETRSPEEIRLFSAYEQTSYEIPANYQFVRRLQLANLYWWPNSSYGYDIFVNERATPQLVEGIEMVDINPARALGYQRPIFHLLLYLTRLNP